MKRHSIRSARSRSKQTSVNKLSQGGTRIDRLYYGKYLPLRETKLLEQIMKTRTAYDDVRNELMSGSGSSEHTQTGNELRLRDQHDNKKNNAAMKTVGLEDRGRFGSSNECKLSNCCSSCSCSCTTLKFVEKHVERHQPPYRHHVPSENITKYIVEAEKTNRRRRRRLSTKISSKFRNINYKMKRIQSEPLSSIVTRPSKVIINRSRSKATAVENGIIQKENNKKDPLRKNTYAFKIAKMPMNSSKKIKNTHHSATKDDYIDIEKQKPFEIKKDSLSLFRQKIKKDHSSYKCEPGSCFVDNCIPENCLYKINARNLGYTKRNKCCSHYSGSGRSHVSVTKRLRNRNTRKPHDQVTTTRTPKQKSFSSMTTLSLRNSFTGTDYVRTEPKKVGTKCPKRKPFTQIKMEKILASEHMPCKRTASVIFCNRGQECKPTKKCSRSLTTILHSHTLQSVPKTEITKVMKPVTPRPRQQLATRKSEEKAYETDHCNKKRMQNQSENKTESISSSSGVLNNQITKLRQKEKRIYTIGQQKPIIHFRSRKVEPFKVLNRSTSSMTKAELVNPLKQEKRYKIFNHTISKEPKERCTSGREKNVKNNQPIRTQLMSKASQAPLLPIANRSRHRKNQCDSGNCDQRLLYKTKGRRNAISVQSPKNTERIFNTPRAKIVQGSPIKNIGNSLNVEYFYPHRRAGRIISNFGFYKNKTGMEGGDQAHSKYRIKQKGVQLERKNHGHKMQNISRPSHNTASQSRSSQFENKQFGNRLKQCLCSLKLFQKKRQKKLHVSSKKTVASIYTEELKNGGHKKQTQTKQLGISLVTPPLVSIRARPVPCEPFFCTPEDCNAYDCAERKKMRNHTAKRSKVTNTIPISKRSSAVTTRPLSKSISRKIQSNENRLRKEKGNNANTLKIKFEKKQYKLKSGNTIKKENQGYQQPGINVYKPHDHHKSLETKTDEPKHTYTEPFLKKWLCTLGFWKNNKDCLEISRPLRNKNAPHFMQLQNKLITANRADIIYNYARPKLSCEYKSETRASNVNGNLIKSSQRTQENSNKVHRKAISDNPNTSSKEYNQNNDNGHFDCKTNFLNQCYLPVPTGSQLNFNNEFSIHHQALACKTKNCVYQKALDVTPIQQYKGTHSYFGTVIKRFFSFNLNKKHKQLENQNIIFQQNTQATYGSSHINRNATMKLNKSNVYRKHCDGDSNHYIHKAKTYNPCGHYDGTQLQQMTRAFDNCIRTDKPKKKSVTNNLKSKSTQSKIFRKYAQSIPHRNGRTTHPRSNVRLAIPIRSNFNVGHSRNRSAFGIHNSKDILCYKDTVCEPTLKRQLSQKNKKEDGISKRDSLLKRYFYKPILEQKNTNSKPKTSNRQTNSNQTMTTKLNSNDLQASRNNPQSISKSDFIFGQNSIKKANYTAKRMQNNYTLAKSRQFRSRTDFNVREYQIGYCLSTRENNPFKPSLYAPNVRAFNFTNVPLKVPTNCLFEVNKCEPGVCSQYECDINNRFQRSKLYYADTLGSNLEGCYKHKSDEKADVIYSKTQNVGKGKNRPVRSHVNTRMGGNNDVDRYRKPELDNQTFLSKCFRSLFMKKRHNNVNQSVMTKNHSDPQTRKVPHFRSDLLNDAKFLKQAKPNHNFASNDKTQALINNHHIRNISSQVHYKTHSRATGITKLLRRCFCTANMQYEVQKQVKSQKVLNNLNLNNPIIKHSKTTRKLKHFEEPIKLDRPTRTKIYNVTKDEYSKDNFKERMSHSTRTYKRIHQNSQIISTNYPTYNTTSYLSERSRTYEPKVQYKSREWMPYPNYCVLRCENSENSKFVQFNSNFGMCIDYPKNKHGNTCPGTGMDKCNQQQGTGDGHGPTAKEGKASKKSQIEVDYTDKSIGEQQLNSKNTQFKRKKNSKSKSVSTSHDTRTQQENINGYNPTIILLEEKQGGIIQATQTDRELKTIMPYSKKKFHKLDSTTKLSHHSTNTPGIKKTRTKGQKRNEKLVSNKYGDYLVYHQQSLKCNTLCQYGQKTKGSDNKSPGDNIVADRNAKQDNIIANRNATQDNIIANREASQDDSDETRLERIRKNFRRRPREKSDIKRPLSENMAPKGNIIVLDKDEELPRSDHNRPLGRWRRQNGRNAKQDNIIANRKATQDDIIAKGDATQDDSDDIRFERIKRAFRRRPREKINIQEDPDAKRDVIILRPRAAPDNVVVDGKEKEDNIDETRLELIKRAFRRRPTEQPAPQPAPQEPLFEMVVHKNDMSIANPHEVLPMLNTGRVYRGTAAPAQQPRPRDRAAPDSIDDRLELLRRAFRRKPKQPESEKPLFEMVVHKNKMLVMNKDEVFPILDSPEKRYRSRKDEPCAPPVMEMHVDRTTASIINADEIVTKLKAERQRQIVKKHRGGFVSQSEGEALVKLHGKTCNCCFCRKYKLQAQKKKKAAVKKIRHLKTCTCGSDVCLKDWTKLRDEQADMNRMKAIPPCVCGSDVCKDEFEKMPKIRLEAARRQRQKEINELKHKKYQQARRRRLRQYRSQDLKRIRRRETADRRQMNKIKKIKGASPVVMAVESIRDLGAYGFRCLGGSIRSFSRVVRRPKDAVYNLQDTVRTIKRRPDTVVKKIKQNYKDSGLKSTLARIKQRAVRTTIGNRIKTRMESNAITNYLVHITDPDPKARMQMLKRKKRRRRRRHTEPVDFECSLYMNTLRKRPFLRVYYMCPWFYPHCVNLFGLWKQLANVLMFLMAVCVWSPCILCFELCRAMACCCMCTGYDM